MMKKYVIHKSSRNAGPVSYNGPTWDNADLRYVRYDIYEDKEYAEYIAKELSKFNPVGFEVTEIRNKNDTL